MHWLKENWFRTGVLTIIFVVGLSVAYYFISSSREEQTRTEQRGQGQADKKQDGEVEDLTVDIDISDLSYQLPSYTKICLPETKQHCSETGCVSVKPTVFILYDENNNTVYRCDNKPCDGYEVNKNESGLFTVLEPIEPKAFSVKLSFDDKYIETVGFGLDTLVSHGTCK